MKILGTQSNTDSSVWLCCDKMPGKKQLVGGDVYFDFWYKKGYNPS